MKRLIFPLIAIIAFIAIMAPANAYIGNQSETGGDGAISYGTSANEQYPILMAQGSYHYEAKVGGFKIYQAELFPNLCYLSMYGNQGIFSNSYTSGTSPLLRLKDGAVTVGYGVMTWSLLAGNPTVVLNIYNWTETATGAREIKFYVASTDVLFDASPEYSSMFHDLQVKTGSSYAYDVSAACPFKFGAPTLGRGIGHRSDNSFTMNIGYSRQFYHNYNWSISDLTGGAKAVNFYIGKTGFDGKIYSSRIKAYYNGVLKYDEGSNTTVINSYGTPLMYASNTFIISITMAGTPYTVFNETIQLDGSGIPIENETGGSPTPAPGYTSNYITVRDQYGALIQSASVNCYDPVTGTSYNWTYPLGFDQQSLYGGRYHHFWISASGYTTLYQNRSWPSYSGNYFAAFVLYNETIIPSDPGCIYLHARISRSHDGNPVPGALIELTNATETKTYFMNDNGLRDIVIKKNCYYTYKTYATGFETVGGSFTSGESNYNLNIVLPSNMPIPTIGPTPYNPPANPTLPGGSAYPAYPQYDDAQRNSIIEGGIDEWIGALPGLIQLIILVCICTLIGMISTGLNPRKKR